MRRIVQLVPFLAAMLVWSCNGPNLDEVGGTTWVADFSSIERDGEPSDGMDPSEFEWTILLGTANDDGELSYAETQVWLTSPLGRDTRFFYEGTATFAERADDALVFDVERDEDNVRPGEWEIRIAGDELILTRTEGSGAVLEMTFRPE